MRLFVALLLILQVQWSFAAELAGKVIRIVDGDTITLHVQDETGYTQEKIRLNGIDAPESSQAYGQKSKQALGGFLKGKTVTVKTESKDRYGRHIGTVFADGVDANAWLVKNGWAWHYKKYSKDRELAQLEVKARSQKLGLWADSSQPIPPWEYRSLKKQSTAIKKGEASSLGYWLNTSSGVRHNSSCRYYNNTKKGRVCKSNEGKACGQCGG
jgi:endonuclease YncB( thermonuclease family)